MMYIQQFRQYLLDNYGSDLYNEQIKPRINEIVYLSLLSVAEQVSNRDKSFELFGYDFMIDSNFNPWLIEVNTSPSLNYET